jgi:RND family efflux transporter MFP subunit
MNAEPSVWLETQCRAIHGTACGLVVLGKAPEGHFAPAAVWPAETATAPSELVGASQIAISTARPVLRSTASSTGQAADDVVAVPIFEHGTLAGAVAVRVARQKDRSGEAIADFLEHALRDLELVEPGLAAPEAKAQPRRWPRSTPAAAPDSPAPAERADRAGTLLDLVVEAIDRAEFRAVAIALVNEFATQLRCERVSLGFVERGEVDLVALSHSARFDSRSKLAHGITAAMEEAVDQEAVVAHPPIASDALEVSAAHADLCAAHGSGAVCSIPLLDGTEIVGALCFELLPGSSFQARDVAFAEQAGALLGPILMLKRRDARPTWRVAWDSVDREARAWLEPERPGRRWLAGLAAGLTLFLFAAPGTYRVSAPATLEGAVQRVIAAPSDGYIAESRARAGDVVKRGEVLGAIDDSDLKLERRKWAGRRAQIERERRAAGAANDRSQLRILGARLEQANAEIALLDGMLARTRLLAPFDGVVAKGDLSQSMGSPVKRGDVLFEVAPLESYRIVLEVDEREIADVARGQRGELALSALPRHAFALRVERITPLATAEDGRNFFRVEAQLAEPSDTLRPGMEGVGKIDIGRRSLIWIWTHRLIDWLRLAAWSWLP